MILYHFTELALLEDEGTILEEGLRPHESYRGDALPPLGVVWLTIEEDYRWANGMASERGNCRIRLAIPSHDRRLVHWPKWLRKRAPAVIELLALCDIEAGSNRHITQMNTTWCYFGNVPLTYFRAVEYADPAERAAYEANPDAEAAA